MRTRRNYLIMAEHFETTTINPAQEFQEAEEDFIFPHEISYTHLKESTVEMKLREDGQMVIYEGDEEMVSRQFKKVKKEKTSQKTKELEEPKWKEYLPYFIFPKEYWVTELFN